MGEKTTYKVDEGKKDEVLLSNKGFSADGLNPFRESQAEVFLTGKPLETNFSGNQEPSGRKKTTNFFLMETDSGRSPEKKRFLRLAGEAFFGIWKDIPTEKQEEFNCLVEKAASIAELFFANYEKRYETRHPNRKDETLKTAFNKMYEFIENNDNPGQDDIAGGNIPLDEYERIINKYFEWMDLENRESRFEHFCNYNILYYKYREIWDGTSNYWSKSTRYFDQLSKSWKKR